MVMGHRMFLAALVAAATGLGGIASAQQIGPYVFRNPCERGPVPEWELINSSRAEFIRFLLNVRPAMPLDVAEYIAAEVCDDISILGNNDALSRRTQLLIRQAGY
jgi:hypothetical protein